MELSSTRARASAKSMAIHVVPAKSSAAAVAVAHARAVPRGSRRINRPCASLRERGIDRRDHLGDRRALGDTAMTADHAPQVLHLLPWKHAREESQPEPRHAPGPSDPRG